MSMTNNYIFLRLLHLTGVGRDKNLMIEIFKLGGINATPSKIKGWRTALDNSRCSPMPDKALDGFLSGLFEYRDQKSKEGVNVFNFLSKAV